MSLHPELKSSKSEFLGEGSYGCVYYPGITCNGKKNKKKLITKIQEIMKANGYILIIDKPESKTYIIQ